MRWTILSTFSLLLSLVQCISFTGPQLLAVLEDVTQKDKYSHFWSDLEARGYKISYEVPKADRLSLFKHGERAYDHVIIFPTSLKSYGPNLTPQILLEYLKAEGNILLALSGASPRPNSISSLLLELDIQLPPERNAVVVDHFNYDTSHAATQHDVILVQAPKSLRPDVKNYFAGEGTIAVPRAVGQVLGNDSPLLAPILRAPSTSYSYDPKDSSEGLEDLFASGQQLALATAFQARNSARFTVLGSSELLENTWFDAKVRDQGRNVATRNREFAKQLTEWTFKEVGVVKVGVMFDMPLEAARKENSSGQISMPERNPKIYRIKSDVSFSIELSEYYKDRLIPLELPVGDEVQLEFSMLSPFHRRTLQPVVHGFNSTFFTTSFKTPDQHGIFNFRVNYKRPFLTSVDEKRQVTVRHFAHDEWPRSWNISAAWVWISGIWVTVLGWLAFCAIWLYSAPQRTEGVKKTQ